MPSVERKPQIRRKARAGRKRVLAEALLFLTVASLAIQLVPFRRTARFMQLGLRPNRAGAMSRDALINQCRWSVDAWADRVPWRAVCFQRGLALHMMLRRRGVVSVLHYGVAQDERKGLHAHVWVSVDGRPIIGGAEAANYACVATFPAVPA